MIVGFVNIQDSHSFFSKFQALEFLSLAGTGAASIIQSKPLMCNGANLAFKKDAFYQFGGYSYGKESPSGDDTYLMLQMASQSKSNVLFNIDHNSMVTTKPLSTTGEFINQRIRWASKVKNYREGYIKRTGLFLFIIHLFLILLLAGSVFNQIPWIITGVLWLMKMAVDFIFLYHISAFSRQQHLLLLFLPTFLVYPFYSLVATILSLFKGTYTWKERNY
jgi:cellulose synthase/poly-beta-1,6-N-acetylglucosamine synthase-like glycosyltransferase